MSWYEHLRHAAAEFEREAEHHKQMGAADLEAVALRDANAIHRLADRISNGEHVAGVDYGGAVTLSVWSATTVRS